MSRRPALWISAAFVVSLALVTREVIVSSGAIAAADAWFEQLLIATRSASPLKVFGLVTLLGDAVVVISIAGLTGIAILFYKLDRAYLAGLFMTLVGAAVSDHVMKAVIARPRPGGSLLATIETSYSFPSGHATATLALYGFIAYMLCQLYPRHAGKIIAIAFLVIIAVGASRPYLGVHFPSDVIAGYLLGGLWLSLGIAFVTRKAVTENHS